MFSSLLIEIFTVSGKQPYLIGMALEQGQRSYCLKSDLMNQIKETGRLNKYLAKIR